MHISAKYQACNLALISSLLTGCWPKLDEKSVCKSGGECCALSFSTDVNGQPTSPSWYRCVKDNKCPPDDMAGRTTYPTFPVKDPPEGKCEAQYKNQPIWHTAAAGAADLGIGVIASLQSTAAQAVKAPKRIDGTEVKQTDGDYCAAMCSNPNDEERPIVCQGATVKNDISLALLRLTARIVRTPPEETKVIPITDVLSEFNVPADGLAACPRSDVIVQNGMLINQGKGECNSPISVASSAVKLNAYLLTPYELRADIKSFKNVAIFSSASNSFSLKWDGKYSQEYFGGPIVTATEARGTDVVVGVNGQHGVKCAAIEPEVSLQTNLHRKIRIANSNPKMVSTLAAELRKLRASTTINQSAQSGPSTLLPISTELHRISASSSRNPIFNTKFFGAEEYKSENLTAVEVASLVDARRCGVFLQAQASEKYMQLLPEANSSATKEVLEERNRIAGEILLCTKAAGLLSAAWNAEVDKVFGRLP